MKTIVHLVEEWPQPDTVNPAVVVANGSRLLLCYGTGDNEFAVLTFPSANSLKKGGPNDESLSGHPLYALGLKHYSVHRIENSPWLHELERVNSVHPSHDAQRFLRGKVHYLFALKEETIECIASERDGTQAQVKVFASQQSALEFLRGGIDA